MDGGAFAGVEALSVAWTSCCVGVALHGAPKMISWVVWPAAALLLAEGVSVSAVDVVSAQWRSERHALVFGVAVGVSIMSVGDRALAAVSSPG